MAAWTAVALAAAAALLQAGEPGADSAGREDDPARAEAGREEPAVGPASPGDRILPVGTARPSPRLEDRPEAGPGIPGILLGSGAVLALMAGTFALLRRFLRGSRFVAGGGVISVLARKPLGPKQELFLVEVGPRLVLVGATRERLSLLGELSDPGEVASLRARLEGERPGSVTGEFRASLEAGLRGGEDPEEIQGTYAAIAEEVAEIRSRVRAWRT